MKKTESILPFIDLQRTGYKNNTEAFFSQMEKEYQEIKPFLPDECHSVLDIGCGLGTIDLFLKGHYKGKEVKFFLADQDKIDSNIHYGFKGNGSFYNSFSVAEDFLRQNGLENFKFIKSERGEHIGNIGRQDIIISLLSCGYHYPVWFYLDKVNELLSSNGAFIIDIRENTDGIKHIKQIFPDIKVIRHENKAWRICAKRLQVKKQIIGDIKKERPIPYTGPMRWEAILKRIPMNEKIIGAEIGVLCGETASRILKERPLVTHIMIDPWQVQGPESSFTQSGDNCSKQSQKYHDSAYQITVDKVKRYGARAIIKRMYSVDAVKTIPDKSLFYVFIDGNHSYPGCLQDNQLWFPKVKPGGWIGGHDYGMPRTPGVKQAVDEFYKGKEIELDYEDTWFYRIPE